MSQQDEGHGSLPLATERDVSAEEDPLAEEDSPIEENSATQEFDWIDYILTEWGSASDSHTRENPLATEDLPTQEDSPSESDSSTVKGSRTLRDSSPHADARWRETAPTVQTDAWYRETASIVQTDAWWRAHLSQVRGSWTARDQSPEDEDEWWRGQDTWWTPGEAPLTDEVGPPREACRGINIESLTAEHGIPGLGIRQGYKWHADLNALRLSRQTCNVCLWISHPFGMGIYFSRLREASVWLRCTGLRKWSQPRPVIERHASIRSKDLELGLIQKRSSDDTDYVENWDAGSRDHIGGNGNIRSMEVVTFEGDVAAEMTNLRVYHPIGSSTTSTTSFETARKWIQDCISLPDSSNQHAVSDIASQPRRLLHIDRGSVTRLVDVSDFPVDISYAALSYKWGKGPFPWKTTKTNVAKRLRNFHVPLPATIKEAVDITHTLGIKYLWVDALCIIQDDDDDWRLEAAKMGKIYQDSVVCIAANIGDGSHGGCFNSSSKASYASQSHIELVSPIHDGRFSRLGIVKWGFDIRFEDRSSADNIGDVGPLAKRAWVLQERLLSSRILYYTEDQLFWECQHCALAEDGLFLDVESASPPEHSLLRLVMENKDLPRANNVPSLSSLWYHWVVEHMYSTREMTMEKDKLVALSGIARAFAVKKSPARYIAGLWTDDLHYGLSWIAPIGEPTSMYQAPSWSWASQMGRVNYNQFFDDLETCSTGFTSKHCHVVLLGDDEFGGVESARLKLETRLLPGIVCDSTTDDQSFYHPDDRRSFELCGLPGKYSSLTVHIDSPDADWLVDVKCMLLTSRPATKDHECPSCEMLILQEVDGHKTYGRIGLASFQHKESAKDLIHEFNKAPLQTITLV